MTTDDFTPPADQATPSHRAGLRDRLAAAIHADLTSTAYRRDGGLLGIVPRLADAVLAVLYREWPWLRAEAEDAQPADQTAVTPPPTLTEEGRLRARVQVLEEDADHNQGLAKVGARCMREGHQGLIESGRATVEGHRFALSVALGLGTGAPWDSIHERVKVLAVLPEAADRAAVLADVERAIRSATGGCGYKADNGCDFCNGVDAALDQVHRMADETAAAQPQPRHGDAFEQWLKTQRDEHRDDNRGRWSAYDDLLDLYRLHADTGTPLGSHVCEAKVVGDCECLDQPAAARLDGATP